MWPTGKRIKQYIRFIFLTFCRTFSVYSVILTIWSYIKNNCISVKTTLSKISLIIGSNVSSYSVYIHLTLLFISAVVMFCAYKSDELRNTRLLHCKELDTGAVLFYFQKNKILRPGALIQILKIEHKTATPYAIGRVDSYDEHNEKRIKVKLVEYNTKHKENLTVESACKKFFYYPFLQDSADIIRGDKVTKIIRGGREK